MPIPIKPNSENNLQIDYSILFSKNLPPIQNEANKKIVLASDKDADLLMEVWINGEKKNQETFALKRGSKITSGDILRLKSHGLMDGTAEEFKLTNKGKIVITTLVLGENNSFLKDKKSKKYTEILASMNKRGKAGYRIPTIAANSHLIRLPKEG
jgi:hypothetical protein